MNDITHNRMLNANEKFQRTGPLRQVAKIWYRARKFNIASRMKKAATYVSYEKYWPLDLKTVSRVCGLAG